MVRTYVKKTERSDIDEVAMKNAVREVVRRRMSERVAARNFNVKRDTLHSRIAKLKTKYSPELLLRKFNEDSGNESNDPEDDQAIKYSSKYTVTQVFTADQEAELVKYIKICSDMNYGMTYKQIRILAYEYANILPACKFPEGWHINKKAGVEWLKGFMRRNHDKISLRKPEHTSLARATGFNKKAVNEFFNNYVTVLKKFNFKPENIYNIDESGVNTVLKAVKIVATKGKKQVSLAASAERGELTTFVGIINAIGNTLPPVYIFPRIRHPEDYLTEAPPSSLALGSKNGWITSELFLRVLEHIVKHSKCSNENKILLLLDNHESHTTLKAVNFCRDNGIVMLSFPPHTSHKLQPLDISIFGPFKTYCATSFNDWMTMNPGKAITIKQIAQLTKPAFQQAFSQTNIIKSFEKPGLWPLNRLAFKDEEFIASYVDLIPSEVQITAQTNPDASEVQNDIDTPSTSRRPSTPRPTQIDGNMEADSLQFSKITPESVRPFPRPKISKQNNKKTKRGKSRIYTDTPEKNRLEELENEKINRKNQQEERKRKKVTKQVFPGNRQINNSKEEIKKGRRNPEPYSSSSDSEASVPLESDSLRDDFTENDNDVRLLQDDEQINNGDFLLIKFPTKTCVKHYVGKVLEKHNLNEYQMQYLRRKSPYYTFFYPLVDDISTVDRADRVSKLPAPNTAKTARTSSLLSFPVNLEMYNVC